MTYTLFLEIGQSLSVLILIKVHCRYSWNITHNCLQQNEIWAFTGRLELESIIKDIFQDYQFTK